MLKFNEILDFKKNRSFKLPVLFGNNSETSINHHWNPKVTHKLFEAFFEIVTVCSLVYNKIPVILLLMKIGPSGAQYYFCFNLYFFKTKNH